LEQLWKRADDARREAEETARRYRDSHASPAEERNALLAATQAAEKRAQDIQRAVEAKERETRRLNEVLL
jgi:hypothetical protein